MAFVLVAIVPYQLLARHVECADEACGHKEWDRSTANVDCPRSMITMNDVYNHMLETRNKVLDQVLINKSALRGTSLYCDVSLSPETNKYCTRVSFPQQLMSCPRRTIFDLHIAHREVLLALGYCRTTLHRPFIWRLLDNSLCSNRSTTVLS